MDEKQNNNSNNISIDDLSSIIENSQADTLYDINTKNIDDLIWVLLKNNYDFLTIEVLNDYAKITFKKDSLTVWEYNIKFNIYSNLLLNLKKFSNLDLSINDVEQKWKWTYKFENQDIELITKVVPTSLWENIFFKVKKIETTSQNIQNKKPKISAWKAFSFLAAILFIVLVFGWVFLTFIVLNAKTPQDVSFFSNLWINLNDVNSFLQKLSSIIFWIVLFIETIIWIIFLFKTLTTKKEFKKKRTTSLVLSILSLVIIFTTGTLWLAIDKKIKALPNWQEMSYWNIQVYDNSLLVSWKFEKQSALINDYTNIIWPIDLKFDLKYLKQEEAKKWFNIKKFIWDFGNWKKLETLNSDIIQTFDKKWTYSISLMLEWIDSRMPWKLTTKEAWDIPTLDITNLVTVSKQKLANGWMTYKFDATDLKQLWKIEWYLDSDINNPAYVWETFQPSKVYFDQELIWMKINSWTPKSTMDKLFVVSWESSKITWDIEYIPTINDFEYTLTPKNITNSFWDWFIQSFKWKIDDTEIEKTADLLNLETSWQIVHKFKNYWKQIIKLQIINSNWKSVEISKEVNIKKQINLVNKIEFYVNQNSYTDYKYVPETKEYSLYNIWFPTKLTLDAKTVRSDNPLYELTDIKWDLWNDNTVEKKWKIADFELNSAWFYQILVTYQFVHRRDKTDTIEVSQIVNIEVVQKDAFLVLDLSSDSEYAPALVKFDASTSKVKDDNIIKFIYDYGDWISEERDAVNPGHRYLKEWNYTPKLTVVTEKWKTYSISKNLIIKPRSDSAHITTSMKQAPINQEIDFSSSWSEWQIKSYFWDFWDGETSTEANPSHAYKKAWTYWVKLILDYDNNNTLTTETKIEITE